MKTVMRAKLKPAAVLAGAIVLTVWAGVAAAGEATFGAKPEVSLLRQGSGGQGTQRSASYAKAPAAKEVGGQKWIITFTAAAETDATVAVLGPDGRIVRHLVSGVLGKNAPEPFKKDSLAQSIEWDGKDDAGNPAAAGCKVKVSLGLKPGFERTLVVSPAPGFSYISGVVVGPDGKLYVIDQRVVPGTNFGGVVHVFDREGNYLYSIWPPGADKLDAPALPDGRKFPAEKTQLNTGAFPISISRKRQMPVVTKDGRILVACNYEGPGDKKFQRIAAINTDGGLPKDFQGPQVLGNIPAIVGRQGGGASPCNMALSPDEKYIYVSGVYVHGGGSKQPATHSVFRVQWTDKDPAGPKPFIGEWTVPGDDEKHFNDPRGIATDKDGNIYVSDWGNNRIQVFKPDGGFVKSLPVSGPDWLAVHPETGDIYVLSLPKDPSFQNSGGPIMSRYQSKVRKQELLKLSPDGKTAASLPLPRGLAVHDYNENGELWMPPLVALDAGVKPAALWLAYPGEGDEFLWKVVDQGGALAKVKGFSDERASQAQQRGGAALAVDAEREEVYAKFNTWKTPHRWGFWYRFNGETGEVKRVPIDSDGDLFFGKDGMLYLDGFPLKGGKHALRRFDRDFKEVPFPAAPQGIPLPMCGDRSYWGALRGCLAVTRSGDLYMAPHAGFKCPVLLYGPDGALKKEVIRGVTDASSTLCVDAAGNLYISDSCAPADGKAVPAHLRDIPEAEKRFPEIKGAYGAVFKFPPAGGEFADDKSGAWNFPRGIGTDRRNAQGALWSYYGHSNLYGIFGNRCVCLHSVGGGDDFGRSFVPDIKTFSVVILDTAGNLVTRVGSYGAFERNQKAGADPRWWQPHHVAASDKAMYVLDSLSALLVKVKLGYAAEETVPVP